MTMFSAEGKLLLPDKGRKIIGVECAITLRKSNQGVRC